MWKSKYSYFGEILIAATVTVVAIGATACGSEEPETWRSMNPCTLLDVQNLEFLASSLDNIYDEKLGDDPFGISCNYLDSGFSRAAMIATVGVSEYGEIADSIPKLATPVREIDSAGIAVNVMRESEQMCAVQFDIDSRSVTIAFHSNVSDLASDRGCDEIIDLLNSSVTRIVEKI